MHLLIFLLAAVIVYAHSHEDCAALYDAGNTLSGIYTIKPTTRASFNVYCDMSDSGWIVIQHRLNGSVDFNRTWNDYVNGFGQLDGEHWLGLDKIWQISNITNFHRIRYDMNDTQGRHFYAEFGKFGVGSADQKYSLLLSNETIINHLNTNFIFNNGMSFSTYDNDTGLAHCFREEYGNGGWWFSYCAFNNLNGRFGVRNIDAGFTLAGNPLQSSVMKIKK